MTGAADPYVVLGATGGISRAGVTEAAARGHRVRAVSRSAGSARDLPVGVERAGADGHVWHLTVAEPLTTRQSADLVAAETGRPVKLRGTGVRTLRLLGLLGLLGLVVPRLRELAGVAYRWQDPFVVDDSAFRTAFPDAVRVTAHPDAIAVTVDRWRGASRPELRHHP